MRKLAIATLLLGLAAGISLTAMTPQPAVAQCSMCRTAFDSPEGRRMVRRYQAGIAFLLTVPIAAFGTVAYFAVKGKRRVDDAEREAQS